MASPTSSEALLAWAGAVEGCQVAWAPASVLAAVRADLDVRRHTGEIDERFARESLDPAFA